MFFKSVLVVIALFAVEVSKASANKCSDRFPAELSSERTGELGESNISNPFMLGPEQRAEQESWGQPEPFSDSQGSMADESGFVNFLNLGAKVKEENEGVPPLEKGRTTAQKHRDRLKGSSAKVQRFFDEQGRLASFDVWKEAFVKNEDGSAYALELVGRGGLSRNKGDHEVWYRSHRDFAEGLHTLTSSDMSTLSAKRLLLVFSVFKGWRLLPSKKFQVAWQGHLSRTVGDWSQENVRTFANIRAKSPMEMTPVVSYQYARLINNKFSSWSLKTQVAVLGAELLRARGVPGRTILRMVEDTVEGLRERSTPAQFNEYEQLYRRNLFYQGRALGSPRSVFEDLGRAIEETMQGSNKTLNKNFAPEEDSFITGTVVNVTAFERLLQSVSPSAHRFVEYFEPNRPGLFDPVDAYWKDDSQVHTTIFPLVVEGDGLQHYHLQINSEGKVIVAKENLILRPKDVAKDESLRNSGVNVVRVNKFDQIDSITDVYRLIHEQNPGIDSI